MLFTLFGDVFLDSGDAVPLAVSTALLQPLGFRPETVRAALARMAREGWFASTRHGRQSSYHLTPLGVERLTRARQRIYQREEEPWNGLFHTLGLSSPSLLPSQRRLLVRELQWVGWAQVGPYQWVTPIDRLDETWVVLGRYGVGEAWMLSGRLSGRNPALWIRELYPTEEIDARYQSFIREWSPSAPTVTEVEAFVKRIELVHAWRKFLFVDPGLPRSLLPPHFRRDEARALFHRLYDTWQAPSSHYIERQLGHRVMVS